MLPEKKLVKLLLRFMIYFMTNFSHHVLAINQAADAILKHKVNSLQVIPAVAIKLLRLTHDENANVGDLSMLIETEPTLTAKVLRNVNSAAAEEVVFA
jgi:HD-like signal output (HDOD) protein